MNKLSRVSVQLSFQSVSRSHAGVVRALNEDRVLDHPAAGLWAVADGMGGHASGDLAASRVVAALESTHHGQSGYAYLGDISAAMEATNAALFAERETQGGKVSGATIVVLLAHEGHYACLWAGDSRAYRLSEGILSRITHDHSLVQDLIDAGALDEGQRRSHPSAHVVTRAIGADARVELDRRFAAIVDGDMFLLCSDGLTGCIEDRELETILSTGPIEAIADRLLSTALDRDAGDNVSFVLVRATAF